MDLGQIRSMSRDQVYNLTTSKKICAETPIEQKNRIFTSGARAYLWTNENLYHLEDKLKVSLKDRDMLIVSASGDPFATFAYLGAKDQVGFDTSHRAILWNELKLLAIRQLNFKDFRTFAALDEENYGKEHELFKSLIPQLSKYGQNIFNPLLKEHRTIRKIIKSGGFFRGGGYTGTYPHCNIFTTCEENYEKAREQLKKQKQILIPGGLDKVLELIDHKYGGCYLSNIMDHFLKPSGEMDYEYSTTNAFLNQINSCLEEDSVIITQFEWSLEVLENSKKVLSGLGYNLKIVSKGGNAYGTMSAAFKKGKKKSLIDKLKSKESSSDQKKQPLILKTNSNQPLFLERIRGKTRPPKNLHKLRREFNQNYYLKMKRKKKTVYYPFRK